MMRKILLATLPVLMVATGFAQSYPGQVSPARIPVPSAHYVQEYSFDAPLDTVAWTKQKRGLQVAFASGDQSYFRTEVPRLQGQGNSGELTGWKGERCNIQLLIWSADTISQVRVLAGTLKNDRGQTIASNRMQLHLVRYVLGNYPYGARDVTCGASPYKDLYLMPDRFEGFDRFDLPGRSVRPVWLSLDIPATAASGSYTGQIEVRSEKERAVLPLKLRVQEQLLPPPSAWKHRLDLWQNPWVVAWKNNVRPWSEDHMALLKKHLQLYADAGGKFITTYAVHSPWSDNSYMIEGGMIEWIKKKEGGWRFDYSIFDTYVRLAMSMGIREAITIYTPVPWGFRFRYLEESTGNYQTVSWAPDSPEFKAFWNIFLTDLKKHLEQNGWFGKTYLGINENEMDQTLAAIRVIKQHSPSWKITYAGNWHKELDGLLDDYCFLYGNEATVDTVQKRSARGQTTTYYVCCNPPVPNNFVFSPPVEGRWLGWYTSAHGYDGFLRWAYDAWPADPLRDARHELWPAGDCYLVYPGGNSCVRFEKLREGISDFEKIRILREKARLSTRPSVKALLLQLDQHLKTFLSEKDFDPQKLSQHIRTGNGLIVRLTDELNRSF